MRFLTQVIEDIGEPGTELEDDFPVGAQPINPDPMEQVVEQPAKM